LITEQEGDNWVVVVTTDDKGIERAQKWNDVNRKCKTEIKNFGEKADEADIFYRNIQDKL
jgi:hypothetical protein